MSDEKFEFSGHPTYLEWYQCYDDISSKEWLDGMELKRCADTWDERTIAKWNFFYRPFRPVVGRPQKKMINERHAVIHACETSCREARDAIAREQVRIRQAFTRLITWLVVMALALVGLLSLSEWLVLLPLAGSLVAYHNFNEERRDALSRISQLERALSNKTAEIERTRREIDLLEKEIQDLLKQIPWTVDSAIIEDWLREEIAEMECICLSEFLSKPIEKDDIREHIPQDFGDTRVCGLLVDSWGFLQPTSQQGPLGREGTGLRRAKQTLGERIATWQVGSNGAPCFRFMFFQYVFPLAKNLNICSFFYDFVTRREFGKRLETFQYNHITNYSLREVEHEEEPWLEDQGFTSMVRLLQGKTPKALTIAVSSGNHFRCVLVDEDIVDALNEWLKKEEKFKELKAELEASLKGTTEAERTRIEAEMDEVARQKREIHLNTARTAKAMLAHVRISVEDYIQKFQVPA